MLQSNPASSGRISRAALRKCWAPVAWCLLLCSVCVGCGPRLEQNIVAARVRQLWPKATIVDIGVNDGDAGGQEWEVNLKDSLGVPHCIRLVFVRYDESGWKLVHHTEVVRN